MPRYRDQDRIVRNDARRLSASVSVLTGRVPALTDYKDSQILVSISDAVTAAKDGLLIHFQCESFGARKAWYNGPRRVSYRYCRAQPGMWLCADDA
jgi:hypothetical protein